MSKGGETSPEVDEDEVEAEGEDAEMRRLLATSHDRHHRIELKAEDEVDSHHHKSCQSLHLCPKQPLKMGKVTRKRSRRRYASFVRRKWFIILLRRAITGRAIFARCG